jgi:hypothetical protein
MGPVRKGKGFEDMLFEASYPSLFSGERIIVLGLLSQRR